jgi:hypothetical protein
MMIRYFQSALRRSLRLLILSLLFFPIEGASQDKDEGLELPEVYIYGSHLGKIQLSPKKDFFPYLSKGNLFPHSRPLSPEVYFPQYRRMPEEVTPPEHYWLLVDAGAGNWWADRIFLDGGFRNEQGLLGLRFTDFRRKNWAPDHSRTDDYVRLKGAYGQDNYYLSGNVFYDYEKVMKGALSPVDTATTNEGGAEFLTRLDLRNLEVSILGNIMLFSCSPMFLSSGSPARLNENNYGISARPVLFQDYFDILGSINLENLGAEIEGSEFSSMVSTVKISLRKLFSTVSLTPGVTVFADQDRIAFSPIATVKASFSPYPVCAFISYDEAHAANTYRSIFSLFPFVSVPAGDYQVIETKRLAAGIEGQWRWMSYHAGYKHEDYQNYPVLPLMPVASGVLFSDIKKDVVALRLEIQLSDFDFFATGESGFHEKVAHEPTAILQVGGAYDGFKPFRVFSDIEGSFDIQTRATEKVDIFSLNSGVEYRMIENLALRLEAENIFDQRYEIWQGYTEGGIQFYASLKYKILD